MNNDKRYDSYIFPKKILIFNALRFLIDIRCGFFGCIKHFSCKPIYQTKISFTIFTDEDQTLDEMVIESI